MNVRSFGQVLSVTVLTVTLAFPAPAILLQWPYLTSPEPEKPVDDHLHFLDLDKPGLEKHKALNQAGQADLKSEAASGAVFDGVIGIQHIIQVPPAVAGVLRGPLASAEAKYWRGETKGISEDDLVKTLNSLAANLNAPPGALTTKSQVRSVRLNCATETPSFVGKGLFKKDGTYNETMSPLQAIHCTFVLMDAKSFNPDFSVDPATWEKNLKAHKHTAEFLSHESGKAYGVVGGNSDRLEMWFQYKNHTMTSTDGIALVVTALSTLSLQ